MRRVLAAALVLCASLFAPTRVIAHADLVSAVPADGSTVEGPRVEIVLTFSEALAQGSRGDVIGPAGTVTFLALDSTATTRMVPNQEVDYAAGDYTIEWTSVAEDGDILRGTIAFTVTAPPPTETPPPTAAPSPSATPEPSPSPSPSPTPAPSAEPGNGSGDSGSVIIPIIVALALVAAAAWWLMRRRPSTP